MTNLKKQVAERIRQVRSLAGLNQWELGERLGVTESTVSSYESGRLNLTIETLARIAQAIGVDLQIILSEPEVHESAKSRLNKLGTLFGQLRKAKGWKRNRLTEAAGVAYGTYTKFERGIMSLPTESIQKLAATLDFDLATYLAEQEAIVSNPEPGMSEPEPVADSELLVYAEFRKLRRKEGITADEMADRIGLATASIYAIERGGREMSLKNLHRYAQALGYKLEFTLTKIDNQE